MGWEKKSNDDMAFAGFSDSWQQANIDKMAVKSTSEALLYVRKLKEDNNKTCFSQKTFCINPLFYLADN